MHNSPVYGWYILAFAVRPACMPLPVVTAAPGGATAFS
jgi:hypothetical protein